MLGHSMPFSFFSDLESALATSSGGVVSAGPIEVAGGQNRLLGDQDQYIDSWTWSAKVHFEGCCWHFKKLWDISS